MATMINTLKEAHVAMLIAAELATLQQVDERNRAYELAEQIYKLIADAQK